MGGFRRRGPAVIPRGITCDRPPRYNLHPIPFNRLKEAFDFYPNAEEIRFCQDEPANQGPWPFLGLHLPELIPGLLPMKRVSRRAQSSTSTGVAKVHQFEQDQLIDAAFAD